MTQKPKKSVVKLDQKRGEMRYEQTLNIAREQVQQGYPGLEPNKVMQSMIDQLGQFIHKLLPNASMGTVAAFAGMLCSLDFSTSVALEQNHESEMSQVTEIFHVALQRGCKTGIPAMKELKRQGKLENNLIVLPGGATSADPDER